MTKIKLNNRAKDHLEKWLSDEVAEQIYCGVIGDLRMIRSNYKEVAVDRILAHPDIYWSIIVDWMGNLGWRSFSAFYGTANNKDVWSFVITNTREEESIASDEEVN